jgi:hypothetical protein
VASNASRAPGDIIRCLHDEVRRFAAGVPQVDDLTALVVARS